MGRPLWRQPSIEHRLDIVPEQASHPVLRGVKNMWAQCGGYNTTRSLLLLWPWYALLKGMTPDSPDDESRPPVPAAWTRHYAGKDGKSRGVFLPVPTVLPMTSRAMGTAVSYQWVHLGRWVGGCNQTKPQGRFRRSFQRHLGKGQGRRKAGTKPSDMAGWDSPIVPLQK